MPRIRFAVNPQPQEVGVPRLFVAVWPPPAASAALATLPRPRRQDVRWVPTEHLHITLRFLGEADLEEVVARLHSADLPSATAVVGPAVTMLGRRVVMAPVAGLDALAAAVVAATADLGRPPEHRRFVGHVTLGRCQDESAGRWLSGTPVDLSFPVEEIAVAQSETHPEGARYSRPATVPLGA